MTPTKELQAAEFAELVLTGTATAADVQEKLKLETLPIGSTFFFLVLSLLLLLLLLRSNKANKHLGADEARNGEKTDEMPRVRPSPKMWRAR